MTEIWLRTNRRALLFALTLPVILLMIAGALAATSSQLGQWQSWLGWGLMGSAGVLILMLLAQCRQPRLACRQATLLVFLHRNGPIGVPLEVVEAFFLGRGPSLLPGERDRPSQSMNLIVRLAERATDWRERDVTPALGIWRDGYITIRGTWCEPLTVGLVHRLNHRLAETKRELRHPVEGVG